MAYLVPRLRTSQYLPCYVPSPAWHPLNLHKCPPECVATASVPRPWEETFPKSWQAQLRQPSPGLHRDPSSPTSRTVRLRNFCQSGGCKWHLIIVLICISQITNENKQLFLCLFAIFPSAVNLLRCLPFYYWLEKLFFEIHISWLILCEINVLEIWTPPPPRWFIFCCFLCAFWDRGALHLT